MFRARETLALLTWEPWMHNPKLKRSLHRVAAPALFIRGESDGLVSASLSRRLCTPAAERAHDDDQGRRTRAAAGAARGLRAAVLNFLGEWSMHARWHFSETAYPFLPPADSYPSIRVSLPNRIYDPREGRGAVRPLHRRMADRRGRRRGDHAQRASSDRDLRRSRRAADAGGARPAEQARRGC